MTSKQYTHAYVWIWLPHETKPVVAGKLTRNDNYLLFNYGKSYLARENAIAIYDVELPLQPGIQPLLPGLDMPGCIRDAGPDAWGRRVIMNKVTQTNNLQLDELTFLLESGSDRIGALDFQLSATDYEPRYSNNVSLDELVKAAEFIEKGMPLTPELYQALQHGSSIGGARPKALIQHNHKKYIAKFSSSTDLYNVVKFEFIAMRLAKIVGLNVAHVHLTQSSHKDVLMIERFDRIYSKNGWYKKEIISALTLFGLHELMARYASYQELATLIRQKFTNPIATLKELFSRMIFNILCGNTDDHAKNHAAFWDGEMLTLTPAYDICPQSRVGNEASQAMLIAGDNRMSQIATCLDAVDSFLITHDEALRLVEYQIKTIQKKWLTVCNEAQLSETERNLLWHRQFLNPYVFEKLPTKVSKHLLRSFS